jgi:hypothetical protein
VSLRERFLAWCAEKKIHEDDIRDSCGKFGLDQNLSVKEMIQLLAEVREGV